MAPTESPLYECLHDRSYLTLKSLFQETIVPNISGLTHTIVELKTFTVSIVFISSSYITVHFSGVPDRPFKPTCAIGCPLCSFPTDLQLLIHTYHISQTLVFLSPYFFL